jgi:predicted DNA-binding transcriptional regulator AlpA
MPDEVMGGEVQLDRRQESAGLSVLASMPRDAWVYVEPLARMLGRSVRSVERAVRRAELPPPIKLSGKRVWQAGAILEFLAQRQAAEIESWQKREEGRKPAMGSC